MDNNNTVFRSLELIEKRISEKLTVEYIANSVYCSKYHYQRLFSEIVGNNVMEYVTKRKLTLAGRALLETDAAVIDIAIEYGYESREGFTRSFKAYMGVTPMEYRKYGLAAIKQNTVKERLTMIYSKTTDEILRELNNFIAEAKDTALLARKCELSEYIPFWNLIADKTDKLADKVKSELIRITVIADHPDKIMSMFDIIKILDDVTYQINLVSFNVRLMMSRAIPKHAKIQKSLLQRYIELAHKSADKVKKITKFFNELSSVIIDDMRKAATVEIEDVIQKGKAAINSIKNYENIRYEVSNIVDILSVTPIDKITVSLLEDLLFRLNIICFTGEIEAFRHPQDQGQFKEIEDFKKRLTKACYFLQSIVTPQAVPVMEANSEKQLLDVAFQGNVYLFYIRGEAEKLDISLEDICEKVDSFIKFVCDSTNRPTYQSTADRLFDIYNEMVVKAEQLQERSGAIKFLAEEIKDLGDSLVRQIKD